MAGNRQSITRTATMRALRPFRSAADLAAVADAKTAIPPVPPKGPPSDGSTDGAGFGEDGAGGAGDSGAGSGDGVGSDSGAGVLGAGERRGTKGGAGNPFYHTKAAKAGVLLEVAAQAHTVATRGGHTAKLEAWNAALLEIDERSSRLRGDGARERSPELSAALEEAVRLGARAESRRRDAASHTKAQRDGALLEVL